MTILYFKGFIHPTFDGHLNGFLFATVVNNAAMNIIFMFFGFMCLVFCRVRVELIHSEHIRSTVVDTAHVCFLGLFVTEPRLCGLQQSKFDLTAPEAQSLKSRYRQGLHLKAIEENLPFSLLVLLLLAFLNS